MKCFGTCKLTSVRAARPGHKGHGEEGDAAHEQGGDDGRKGAFQRRATAAPRPAATGAGAHHHDVGRRRRPRGVAHCRGRGAAPGRQGIHVQQGLLLLVAQETVVGPLRVVHGAHGFVLSVGWHRDACSIVVRSLRGASAKLRSERRAARD